MKKNGESKNIFTIIAYKFIPKLKILKLNKL